MRIPGNNLAKHLSIWQIKNFCSSSFHVKKNSFFHLVNEIEIKKTYKRAKFQKSYWNRHNSPKLIKAAVDFLIPILTKSINST